MEPKIINGGFFKDERGFLKHNNSFNLGPVKRFYLIQNRDIIYQRKWQGHKIENRWYIVVQGSFKIDLIKIDNWINPDQYLKKESIIINDSSLDVLHIPPGYVSSIQAIEKDARLLVMSDYQMNEIEDNFKYPSDYFKD